MAESRNNPQPAGQLIEKSMFPKGTIKANPFKEVPMQMEFCQSCGMPLSGETKHRSSQSYCRYCTDEKGNLNPREAVREGIVSWLKMFTPEQDGVDFMKRADNYLKAMPAWAE